MAGFIGKLNLTRKCGGKRAREGNAEEKERRSADAYRAREGRGTARGARVPVARRPVSGMLTPLSPTPPPRAVHKVQKLYDVQLVGKQDPYAVVIVQKKGKKAEKKKTRVARDGHKNPVWDQTFTLSLDGTESEVVIEVFNCNTIKDEMIGSCTVKIKEVCQSKQVFVHRLARGGANTFAGDLHVSGEFIGRGPAREGPRRGGQQQQRMQQHPGMMHPGYGQPMAYDAMGRPVQMMMAGAPQPPVVFVAAGGPQPMYAPMPPQPVYAHSAPYAAGGYVQPQGQYVQHGQYPPQQGAPPQQQQQGGQRPNVYNQQSYA